MYNIVLLPLLVCSLFTRSISDKGTDDNIENRAGNMLYNGFLWPSGVIPYTFDDHDENCPERNCTNFQKMIRDWTDWFNKNSSDCIKFRKIEQKDFYYLKFYYNESVCRCGTGVFRTRETRCYLNPSCNIAGTLLKVLGMDYEWNRIDRDEYVEVLWDNIQSGSEELTRFGAGIFSTMCIPYQFDSLMHRKPEKVIAKADPRTRNRLLPFMIFRHPNRKEKKELFSHAKYPTYMDMYRVRLAYGCIGCAKPPECEQMFKFEQTVSENVAGFANETYGGNDEFTDCRNPDILRLKESADIATYQGGSWCSTKVDSQTKVHQDDPTDPWANRRDCQCKKDVCGDPMPVITERPT